MIRSASVVGISLCLTSLVHAGDWKPAESTLLTRWAADVDPANPLPEYPRPQMVRRDWTNLNGLWDSAIRPEKEDKPSEFNGNILVPFAVESALSGVKKRVGAENRLWYRRTFPLPETAKGKQLLLHFGGVDWHAQVWVNGRKVGEHRGGYDAFSFDITAALTEEDQQELIVSVWDPTDAGKQPRGKQVNKPHGIWYTPVTGIWQSVWLEPVPKAHIESLKIVPDIDAGEVHVTANVAGADGAVSVWAKAADEGTVLAEAQGAAGQPLRLRIPDAKLWSPQSPFLYDLEVGITDGDSVTSYFGMRKIEMKKDAAGINRVWLNGKVLFQIGPLDQGWWPDGLYTAPTDEALRYDVEITRKLGYNMARKHVKVEPRRWYYHCDQLGLLVWQDMPSGGKGDTFEDEWKRVMDTLLNAPSIVMWVPFNEGWGQYDTERIAAWTKKYDPTRLVNEASGWHNKGSGDVHDIHKYPGPAMPGPEENRAAVLGEFGGLGLPVENHLWWNKRNWGYRNFKDKETLRTAYEDLIRRLHPMVGKGLTAAVYTQTSDVEGEVNGLMTYDRKVVKFDIKRLAALHAKLHEPVPVVMIKPLAPTSEKQGVPWRYTTRKPADNWMAADFDDASWKQGEGGFGTKETAGAIVRTEWNTNDIWLRREFALAADNSQAPHLRVHHDEDAVVYINGKQVATLAGYRSDYGEHPILVDALRKGRNVLAVHCRQSSGGQFVDVGIVDVIEEAK